MPRKRTRPAAEEKPEEKPEQISNEAQAPRERLQLFVGVNFLAEGAECETRIEAGFVDLGVLPPRFEQELIERKQARIRLV